jgi:hypothetical protein
MPRAFNYTIIPNDPFSVAQAINDLASRIVDEGVLLAEYILADGSRGLSADWNAGAFAITAKNLISSAAIGTSPYACTSTTLNNNLNADLLDGQHGSYYASASGYVPYTGATGAVNLGAFGLTAASITNTGLTITRVPYVSTGGLLADSAALTFNSGTGVLSATSFSGGNVTSGADPGHTHSAYLTAEADTLATVVARGANAGATINVGAGNTLTLASGSITDSSGAISFNNENLTTTGTFRIDGGLGIGVAPSSGYAIDVAGTKTSSYQGYHLVFTGTPTSADQSYYGLNFIIGLANSTENISEATGVTGIVRTLTNSLYRGIITKAAAFSGFLTFAGNASGTDPTITDAILFDGRGITTSLGTVITTAYGLKLPSITAGVTNYAIYSAGGQSYHAGNFGIGVIPTVPLDVAGAALISTTLGVTGLSTLTGGISLPASANIALATTTGTKIGTATNQLLGFYGVAPVDQPSTISDATTQDLTGTDTIDKTKLEADLTSCKNGVNTIIDRLQELGLIA